MKRVKLQPRQHTIVCNDDELDIILTMIQYYIEQTHSRDTEYARECTFMSANPLIDDIVHVTEVLSDCVGGPPLIDIEWDSSNWNIQNI